MATQQQIDLRKKLLTKAIKPTTNPLQTQKNQKRFDTLNKLGTVAPVVAPVTTPVAPVTVGPHAPALVDPGTAGITNTTTTTTKPLADQTIGTTPYYYGASGTGRGKTVKDPVTGKTYSADSAKGLALAEQYGFTDAPADPITDTRTYDEVGASVANAAYNVSDLETQLFGDSKTETSMGSYYNSMIDDFKRQVQRQEGSLDYQQTQNEQDTSSARNQVEQPGVVQDGQLFAGGREGVSSSSNQALSGTLAGARSQQIARLMAAQDENKAAIEDARANLKAAEKAKRRDLVEQYQSELDAATQAAQQADTDYITALTAASEEERNVQAQKNANLTTFTDLVGNGTELTPESINTYAENLGLDFKTAYDYYAGAQAIRDDKTLSVEEKQIANATNQKTLDDALAGLSTKEAKTVDDYMTLVQSGNYTPDQLQSFAVAMNIPDEKNPVYQTELAMNQAELKIKQNEANGVLTNPLDLIDLAQKTYDYYETMGMNPSVIPTGGEYGAVSFNTPEGYQGVRFNVQDGVNYDNPETTRDESQCGAFVNDVTGIGMGDLFTQKMGLVDKSLTVPAAGMVYVQAVAGPYAKNGHTGMVEYFNPQTGMVGTVSANAKGDGKIVREEIPLSTILNGGGFANPPKSMSADAAITLDAVDKDLRSSVTTKANQFDTEPLVRNFQTIQEGKNYLDSLNLDDLTSSDNQSIIYAFAKIMDPNSVVRESEYDTVQKYAQSLAATYGFDAQRVLSNTEFLTKDAVQNMINTVAGRYDASRQSYDNLRNEFVRNINNLAGGVDVGNSVLQNYSTSNGSSNEDYGTLYDGFSDESVANDTLWSDL